MWQVSLGVWDWIDWLNFAFGMFVIVTAVLCQWNDKDDPSERLRKGIEESNRRWRNNSNRYKKRD